MFRQLNLLIFFLITSLYLSAQPQKQIALVNVNIIDVKKAKVIPQQVVFIEKDRIVDIVPAAVKPKLTGYRVIDGQGNFLMPGLIDTHLHLFYYIRLNKWKELRYVFKLMLANGITGIREAGASVYTREMISLRDSLKKNYFPGPRMYVSGITTESNLKKFQKSSYTDLVAAYKDFGVDGIKIKFTTLKESKEIIDAAKKLGLKVFGHTANTWRNETSNIQGDFTREIIDYGISGVMHTMGIVPLEEKNLPPMPEPVFSVESKLWQDWWLYFDALWLYADKRLEKELIDKLISRNTWLEPTLSIESYNTNYDSVIRKKALRYYFYPDSTLIEGRPYPRQGAMDTARWVFQRKQLFVKKFFDAGGWLLAGTDGSLYGSDLRDELRYFTAAGIPASAALKIVTYNNALALGWQDDLGTVEKGKIASLILLKKNPLDNIDHLEKIESVFSNGHYYSRKELDQWLLEIEELAGKEKRNK